MNRDGTNPIQISQKEGGYPRYVSPDGKWVYFESGLHQTLWRVSTEPGQETQILEGKVFAPAFSRDGSLVTYFVRGEGLDHFLRLVVVSVQERSVVKRFDLADTGLVPLAIAWARDNKSFYYVTSNGSGTSLWQQMLVEGRPQLVDHLGNDEISDLDVAPNGNTCSSG